MSTSSREMHLKFNCSWVRGTVIFHYLMKSLLTSSERYVWCTKNCFQRQKNSFFCCGRICLALQSLHVLQIMHISYHVSPFKAWVFQKLQQKKVHICEMWLMSVRFSIHSTLLRIVFIWRFQVSGSIQEKLKNHFLPTLFTF